MTTFPATLQRFRHARRLSQSRLAERAGMSHSYMSRLEAGARLPSRDAVLLLAGALDLDDTATDVLLASADYLPRQPVNLLSHEPEVAALLTVLHERHLPPAYREALRQTIAALTAQARQAIPGDVVRAFDTAMPRRVTVVAQDER